MAANDDKPVRAGVEGGEVHLLSHLHFLQDEGNAQVRVNKKPCSNEPLKQVLLRAIEQRDDFYNGQTKVYILANQKNSSPPPSKILPCFCGFFFALFKLHKG